MTCRVVSWPPPIHVPTTPLCGCIVYEDGVCRLAGATVCGSHEKGTTACTKMVLASTGTDPTGSWMEHDAQQVCWSSNPSSRRGEAAELNSQMHTIHTQAMGVPCTGCRHHQLRVRPTPRPVHRRLVSTHALHARTLMMQPWARAPCSSSHASLISPVMLLVY